MSLMLKVSVGGVPAGTYLATFAGLESTNNEYGEGLRWSFDIASGEHKGMTASRFTGVNPTLKNAAGKMLAGVSGKPLAPGVEVSPAEYVGKSYLITVGQTESGSTRVESVTPAPVA